jgi:hypothetical protein
MSDKYPRTPHLPWSPGGTSDDRRLEHARAFVGPEIVITEKLDGGNLCMTKNEVFARSHSAQVSGKLYAWAKSVHSQIQPWLRSDTSYFFEYCAWVHTLAYDELPTYFFLLGVRDDADRWWYSWSAAGGVSVAETAAELSQRSPMPILTAPVLFAGKVSGEQELRDLTDRLGATVSTLGDHVRVLS